MSTPAENFIRSIHSAFLANDDRHADKQAEAVNVHRLRAFYEAAARRDFQGFADTLTDDVESEIVGPPSLPFERKLRGKAEVLEGIAKNFSHLEEQVPFVDAVVGQGDDVVVFGRETGRFRESGAPYALHFVQRYTFRDGKIARVFQVVATDETARELKIED
jgi:uncharacterized protein